MRTFGLFAGIGGLELGLSMGGPFESIGFCEQNLYARAVLAKNWPGVPQYDDVRTLTGHALAADGIGRIDVLTGGWPCQPHSVAGKRANSEDERDLWSEFARLVGETRPRWVVGENVPGVLSSHDAAANRGAGGFFGRVLRDLAALGYDAEWHCYPASAVGAHHERSRVFLVAYPNSKGLAIREGVRGNPQQEQQAAERGGREMGHATGQGLPDWVGGTLGRPWPITELERPGGREVEHDFRGMAHGVSARVDRLRCLGNGVVPQQAAVIGRAITEAEAHFSEYGVMPDQIVQPWHLVVR